MIHKYDVNHGHYLIPEHEEYLWDGLVKRMWDQTVKFDKHVIENLEHRDNLEKSFDLIFDEYKVEPVIESEIMIREVWNDMGISVTMTMVTTISYRKIN